MDNFLEWMLAFIPTAIGAIIIAVALFSSVSPILSGYLKLIGLSSTVTNFIKNQLEFLKYLVGPGG